MKCRRIAFISLLMLMILVTAGCDNRTKPNDLDSLKQQAKQVEAYSCDITRIMDGDTVNGKLYYSTGDIRFELYGKSKDDITVTIVNTNDNKTYIYNTKLKTGEVSQVAYFSQDIPTVKEIMDSITSDNSHFQNAILLNDKEYAIYGLDNMPLFGGPITGQIYIGTDNGMPLSVEGIRSGRQVNFQYTNFVFGPIDPAMFEAPADIDMSKP